MINPTSDVVFPFPISTIASLIVVFSVSIVVSVPITAKFPPTKRSSCIYESPRIVTTLDPVSSTENLDPTSSV